MLGEPKPSFYILLLGLAVVTSQIGYTATVGLGLGLELGLGLYNEIMYNIIKIYLKLIKFQLIN